MEVSLARFDIGINVFLNSREEWFKETKESFSDLHYEIFTFWYVSIWIGFIILIDSGVFQSLLGHLQLRLTLRILMYMVSSGTQGNSMLFV